MGKRDEFGFASGLRLGSHEGDGAVASPFAEGANNTTGVAAAGAPVASSSSATVLEDASLLEQHAVASDPNGDPLTFKLVGAKPQGVAFNADGTWSYTPPPSFQNLDAGESASVSFKFTANDGRNISNVARVTIKILGANDRPVASNAAATVYKDFEADAGNGQGGLDAHVPIPPPRSRAA